MQLRQNFQPLRNTLSRAVSGGAKAVSTGRSRLFRGMDALWNEFERGMNEEAPRRSSVDTVNSNASGTSFFKKKEGKNTKVKGFFSLKMCFLTIFFF